MWGAWSGRDRASLLSSNADPGYTQEPRGWYSQLVYGEFSENLRRQSIRGTPPLPLSDAGESFEKGTTAVYAWNPFVTGTAQVH